MYQGKWVRGYDFVNSLRPGQNGRHFADNTDAFSWIEIFVFWLKFHWSLFLRLQLTITWHSINQSIKSSFVKGAGAHPQNAPVQKCIGSDNGLQFVPNRWQAVISTNADLIHWRIYGALRGHELTHWGLRKMATILQMSFSNAFPEKKLCFDFNLQ